MKKKQKKDLAEIKQMVGRRDCGGINPVTRVVPDKKRPKPARKIKHKGRSFETGPFWLPGRGGFEPAPRPFLHEAL